MGAKLNLLGQRFGRLTVIGPAPSVTYGKQRFVRWTCACDCGQRTFATTMNLRSGQTTSCGCYQLEAIRAANTKHGHTPAPCGRKVASPEYICWLNMKARCFNPGNNRYQYYGARGISVCRRWRDSFEAFFQDMGPKPSPAHSIDRIDVNGNYEPGNCRWATAVEQRRNRRDSIAA